MYDFEDDFPPAYNVYGVPCATWAEACEVAGNETPEQLAAEEAFWDAYCGAEEAIEAQDAIEARGGPAYAFAGVFDDIPF